MNLSITDTWRNVTVVPTHWPPDAGVDLFEILRDLKRHVPASSIENGQVEFHCDGPFRDALESRDVTDEFDGIQFIVAADDPQSKAAEPDPAIAQGEQLKKGWQ